jgi:glycosyltransferase involved in cell wall biosynthesis
MRRTIVHFIDTGGPGGAETIFLELVSRLDGERWRSVAVVPTRHWLEGALRERGIEPIHVPTRRSFDAGYLAALYSVAREHGAHLIHTHLLTTAVYGGAVGRLLRIPVVSTFHGAVDMPARDRLLGLKLRVMARPSNRVVFVSATLKRTLQARSRIPERLTRVVHNGIDVEVFAPGPPGPLRAELGVMADELLIGAVGNVRTSKDYENLLRAAAWLRDRGLSHRFVVAGDTNSGELQRLLALRSELRLEQVVRFLGFRADVPSVLRSLDMYVLSSRQEGFSLTTVQAMSCGLPVVATRCGGPEEIITDGVDGVLVDASDPAALGGAVDALACDPGRRARLGVAARTTAVTRFGIAAMVRGYERIYEDVAGACHPARIPVQSV